MKAKALLATGGVVVLLLLPSGCRPGATGPAEPSRSPGGPSGPPDLTVCLGATWTADVKPAGQESGGAHADFNMKVIAELRNSSSATVEAGRCGYAVLEAPNLDIAPIELPDFGGFTLDRGGTKTVKYDETFKTRVQGRKLFLRDLAVRVACTGPISAAGSRMGRVVVVAEFPRSREEAEGKTGIWPYSESYLRLKAEGRDEWAARLAEKLLEDRGAEGG
jgi:hypothetical protein